MNEPRTWDVYETESLVIRKSLGTDRIRSELAAGQLQSHDLIRPAGSDNPWQRIADVPLDTFQTSPGAGMSDEDLLNPDADIEIDPDSGENRPDQAAKSAQSTGQTGQNRGALPSIELQALQWLSEPDRPPAKPPERSRPRTQAAAEPAILHEEPILEPSVELRLEPAEPAVPHLTFEDFDDEEEDDFTLSRSRVEHVEEMDLAAMVDIAFQLVLFFMVTASVTMIKSMELPKPTESTKPAAASAPGVGTRDRNELATEFIVVTISAEGDFLIDDEPIRADRLVESLRSVRNESGKTGMLLRAENRTKHRLAVAAYDAANEIGLRIAIERETSTP